MQSISAYLNYGIKVLYNGQAQMMKDANGKTIYGFIENIEPYSYGGIDYYKASDGKSISLGGITFNGFITVGAGDAYYNLGGNYSELTFVAYCGNTHTLVFKGDNDTLIKALRSKAERCRQPIRWT